MHEQAHAQAGQPVIVKVSGTLHSLVVEDWWDRIMGTSWKTSDGNPAAMNYGFRAGKQGLPLDDEVIYGKIGGMGTLVHISEIEDDV